MWCSVSLIKMTWLFCHAITFLRGGWELKHFSDFVSRGFILSLCEVGPSWALMKVWIWQLCVRVCVHVWVYTCDRKFAFAFSHIVINNLASSAGASKFPEHKVLKLCCSCQAVYQMNLTWLMLVLLMFLERRMRLIFQAPWLKIYWQSVVLCSKTLRQIDGGNDQANATLLLSNKFLN